MQMFKAALVLRHKCKFVALHSRSNFRRKHVCPSEPRADAQHALCSRDTEPRAHKLISKSGQPNDRACAITATGPCPLSTWRSPFKKKCKLLESNKIEPLQELGKRGLKIRRQTNNCTDGFSLDCPC